MIPFHSKEQPWEVYSELRARAYNFLSEQGLFPDLTAYLKEDTIRYVDYLALKDAYTTYILKEPLCVSCKDFYHTYQGWTEFFEKIRFSPEIKNYLEMSEVAAKYLFQDRNAQGNSAFAPRNSACAPTLQENDAARESAEAEARQIVRQIMEDAQGEEKKIKDEAIDFSTEIKKEEQKIAEQIEEDANRQAAQSKTSVEANAAIIQKAQNFAATPRFDATAEVNYWMMDANVEKKRLIAEAEAEKKRLIAEAEAEKQRLIKNVTDEEFKAALEKRINAHFQSEQLEERMIRKNLDEEYDKLVKNKNDLLDRLNNDTQKLQSSLMLALTESFEKLQSVQNEINRELTEWKKMLYKNEFGGIAQCFMNLGRIILSMEQNIAKHLSFGEEDYHKELVEELSKTVKNLKILKNNMEQNLARNSIKLLIPQVGESFNSIYHRAENFDPASEDEDDLNGKRIKEILEPGLIRELNASDDPISRAIVVVEK